VLSHRNIIVEVYSYAMKAPRVVTEAVPPNIFRVVTKTYLKQN